VTIACFCLSACGFHIRSTANIPPQLKTLYISSTDKHSMLAPLLKQNFRELGMNVVNTPQDAPITLAILSEHFSQSKTILGTAQTLNSVNMCYTVTFAVSRNDYQSLPTTMTLTTSTSYLQNASQILEDNTMLPSYQQELIRNMVSQILPHLSTRNTVHALSN
jgi:outer membrane lipopolysaccharide assembly protein LptE/RlpB